MKSSIFHHARLLIKIFIFCVLILPGSNLFGQIRDDNLTDGSMKSQSEKLERLIDETTKLLHKLNPKSQPEEFEKALSMALSALELSQNLKDRVLISSSLFLTSRIFEEKGDSDKAIEYYRKTLDSILEAKTELTDKSSLRGIERAQIIVLKNLGRFYYSQGLYEEAMKFLNQALLLDNGDGQNEKIGMVHRYLGDSQTALRLREEAKASYLKAIEIFNTLGLSLDKGIVLSNLGKLYQDSGKQGEALKCFLEAEVFLEKSPPKSSYHDSRIWNLHRIEWAYGQLNDQANVAIHRDKIKNLQENIISPANLLMDYFTRGTELAEAGRSDEALSVYREGINIAAKYESLKYTQSKFLIQVAFIYFSLGKGDEGKKNITQAIELTKDIKDKSQVSFIFETIGDWAYRSQGVENAIEFWRRGILSLQKDEEMGLRMKYREESERLLNKIAQAQMQTGNVSDAMANFRTSLTIHLTLSNKIGLIQNLQSLVNAYTRQDKKRLAIFFGKLAITHAQEIRASLNTFPVDTQKAFLRSNRNTFNTLIELLLKEHRLAEAQQVFSLLQDQILFDVAGAEKQPENPVTFTNREDVMFKKVLEYEVRLKKFSDDYNRIVVKMDFRKLTEQEMKDADGIKSQILKTAKEFDEVFGEIEKTLVEPVDEAVDVPDIKKMQTMLRNLQSQTGQVVVTIYTLEAKENFRGLIVTPDKIIDFSYPIKIEELRSKQVNFIKQITETDKVIKKPTVSENDIKKTANELYNIIFAPVENNLIRLRIKPDVLMWSLDGASRYLPLGALHDGRQYLVERYKNIIFTRANPEQMLAPVKSKWTGSGFYTSKDHLVSVKGKVERFTGLKNAKTEVEKIFGAVPKRGIVEGDLLPDERFTEESLLIALGRRPSLVHIASHFMFEVGDANSSFLLLGNGNKLTLERIKGMPEGLFKGVELLTLSACETGIQKERESDGREIDSFAELAQRKGATAILASLWKVDDKSTSELMTQFYEKRESKKWTKADALREAQLTLLKSKFFSHPYYWASFNLIGNWR